MDDTKDFGHVGIAGTGLSTKRLFALHLGYPDTVLQKDRRVKS